MSYSTRCCHSKIYHGLLLKFSAFLVKVEFCRLNLIIFFTSSRSICFALWANAVLPKSTTTRILTKVFNFEVLIEENNSTIIHIVLIALSGAHSRYFCHPRCMKNSGRKAVRTDISTSHTRLQNPPPQCHQAVWPGLQVLTDVAKNFLISNGLSLRPHALYEM